MAIELDFFFFLKNMSSFKTSKSIFDNHVRSCESHHAHKITFIWDEGLIYVRNNFSNLHLRAFAPTRAKILVYFSIKTYFFYFTYSLFKTPQFKLSILYYILLKYQFFLIFLIVSFSLHITTTIHSLPSPLRYVKKEKNLQLFTFFYEKGINFIF